MGSALKLLTPILLVLALTSFTSAQDNVFGDPSPSNPVSGISLDGGFDWIGENIGKFSNAEYTAAFVVMWLITYLSIAILVNVVAKRGESAGMWSFQDVTEFLMADDSTSPPARGALSYNNIVLVLSALTLFTLLGGPLDGFLRNFYSIAWMFILLLVLCLGIGFVTLGAGAVLGITGLGSKATASGYMTFRNSPAGRALDRTMESIPYVEDVNGKWNDFLQNQGYKLCDSCGKINDQTNTYCSQCSNGPL